MILTIFTCTSTRPKEFLGGVARTNKIKYGFTDLFWKWYVITDTNIVCGEIHDSSPPLLCQPPTLHTWLSVCLFMSPFILCWHSVGSAILLNVLKFLQQLTKLHCPGYLSNSLHSMRWIFTVKITFFTYTHLSKIELLTKLCIFIQSLSPKYISMVLVQLVLVWKVQSCCFGFCMTC